MSLATTPVSPFLAADGSAGIVYVPTECTVAQAAKFLDMSEKCVDELLNFGVLEFKEKNGERMLLWHPLLEYKQRWAFRQAGIDEMVHMNHEMGLYDD